MSRRQGLRTVAGLGAGLVLVVAVAAAIDRTGPEGGPFEPHASPSTQVTDEATAPSEPSPRASGSDAFDDRMALALLTDVDRAAGAEPNVVRDAARVLLEGLWQADLGSAWSPLDDAWFERAPIVVAEAEIASSGQVAGRMAIVVRQPLDDRLVLRVLPAAQVLGDTAFSLQAAVDGTVIDVETDRDAATVTIDLPASAEDPTHRTVTLEFSYRLSERSTVVDDGGPAGGGLLIRHDDVWTLGHWLPALTFDRGPLLPRGDVGAFDAGIWSVTVEHPGRLVTGGLEEPCSGQASRCTRVHGIGLRDVSGVILLEEVDVSVSADPVAGVRVRGFPPPDGEADAVTQEAQRAVEILSEHFGELPWRQLDVVAVPLAHAGMEFPGTIWIERPRWRSDAGFASYVIAHEVGHQWFHALVGNGSLSAPFIDESLAQYSAYLVFADLYGQAAADRLAQDQFGGRYERAGSPDDPVCLALGDFQSAQTYGAVVYGRGGQIWVDLERRYGRDRVVAVLRELVRRRGLENRVMPVDLVAAATSIGDVDLEGELASLLLDEPCPQ